MSEMLYWQRELNMANDYRDLMMCGIDYFDTDDVDNLGCIGEQIWAVKERLA